MTITLALPKLFAALSAGFAAEYVAPDPDADPPVTGTIPVVVEFGWKQLGTQLEGAQKRVICVPGGPNGDAGLIDTVRFPGRNPRPVATWQEKATWYIFAQDISADDDIEHELAQYQIARELFDDWYRHAYAAAHGTFTVDSIRWVNERVTRRRGAELEVVTTLQAMIPDSTIDTTPGASGNISVILGARTEHVLIEGPQ